MPSGPRNFSQQRERFMQLAPLPISVTLGRFRAEVLYWGFFEPKWWRNYLHAHSFFEICYAYAGEGTFTRLGQDHAIKSGQLFVARPGEPHEIVSARRQALGICFWAFTLTPAGRRTGSPDAGIDAALDAFMTSDISVARAPTAMKQTLAMLADEAADKRPGYTRAVDALVAKLLIDSARASSAGDLPAERVDPRDANPADAIVRTSIRYLRDNFARPITLRDVAAQVPVSERHLSRVILAATGHSVIDYLTALRLDAAQQLLLDPNRAIKSVAAEVGYPDVKYFINLFRRQIGTTPRAVPRIARDALPPPAIEFAQPILISARPCEPAFARPVSRAGAALRQPTQAGDRGNRSSVRRDWG